MTDIHTVTLNKKTSIIPLIKGDVMTTEDTYNPEVKAEAYRLFLQRALSLDDIAVMMSLDRSVLAKWSKKEKWMERKKDIEKELMASVELKFKNWELENKYKVAETQLEQAQAIQELVQETLTTLKELAASDDRMAKSMPGKIKQLADALQACANVGARAVGLGAQGPGAQAFQGQQGGGSGKQPLVIINTQPMLPQAEEQIREAGGQVIDV